MESNSIKTNAAIPPIGRVLNPSLHFFVGRVALARKADVKTPEK